MKCENCEILTAELKRIHEALLSKKPIGDTVTWKQICDCGSVETRVGTIEDNATGISGYRNHSVGEGQKLVFDIISGDMGPLDSEDLTKVPRTWDESKLPEFYKNPDLELSDEQ